MQTIAPQDVFPASPTMAIQSKAAFLRMAIQHNCGGRITLLVPMSDLLRRTSSLGAQAFTKKACIVAPKIKVSRRMSSSPPVVALNTSTVSENTKRYIYV